MPIQWATKIPKIVRIFVDEPIFVSLPMSTTKTTSVVSKQYLVRRIQPA